MRTALLLIYLSTSWAVAAAQGRLTVVPKPGIEGVSDTVAIARIESTEAYGKATVTRDFEVLSTGTEPAMINSLVSSCGCESSSIWINGAEVRQAKLNSGESATIRVIVKLKESDWTGKKVNVKIMGAEPAPLAVLNLEIQQRWFTVEAPVLDLGRPPASGYFEVKVGMDRGLPKSLLEAPLESAKNWVQVTEQPGKLEGNRIVRTFRVSKGEALGVGRHRTQLAFRLGPDSTGPEAAAIRQLMFAVHREVANDLTVSPAEIRSGASKTVEFIVWSRDRASLEGLTLDGAPTDLKATFGDLVSAGSNGDRFMRTVTLTSTGSFGLRRVHLTSKNGSRARVDIRP